MKLPLIHNPTASGSTEWYNALFEQKFRLLTDNLDLRAYTKTIRKVARALNHRYRKDGKIPIELVLQAPKRKELALTN